MSLNKTDYYKGLLKIFMNYRKKNIQVSSMPIRMWVELDARCNLKCVMCPNKELNDTEKGSMDWDVFKKVIDESKEFVYEVALHHRGESLLHAEALKYIHYASEKVAVTKIHTNGTLLDHEIRKGLVETNLKRISISFDGFTKEDYEKVRVGADFDRVVDNIKQLLKLRNQKSKTQPQVALEIIELSQTQVQKDKKEAFIKEFRELGLDELVVKKPHNWAGYLTGNHSKTHYTPCTFLWNALLVLWNGDVAPCAQDFFAQTIVGNVKGHTLKEIWNGAPMQKLRDSLVNGDLKDYPPCQNCDRLWRETILGVPKEYLKKMILKKMP